MQVCFSHGKESGPWGGKISAMADLAREHGLDVASLDYRGMDDPGERVAKLLAHCQGLTGPPLLVGSSMGGHVATAVAGQTRATGLFLLAPAFYMPGYEALTPAAPDCPVAIVHGWRDEVVPANNSIRYAQACGAALHLLDGDHRLLEQLPQILSLFDGFIRSTTAGLS